QRHGFGQRELLAEWSLDEATTPYLAACFETPQHEDELAPCRRTALPRYHASEHDAPASQERARVRLVVCLVRERGGPGPGRSCNLDVRTAAQRGPAAGALDAIGRCDAAAMTSAPRPLVLRREERAQAREAVSSGQAVRCEFTERALDLCRQHARTRHDLVEERCAAAGPPVVHLR